MSGSFRLPDHPRRARADVDREIELHLELRAREFEAAGMSPAEARRAALAAFGDREGVERECVEVRGATLRSRVRLAWLADLGHDLRAALRTLSRAPGFVLVALLTLTVGLGANAAIFSVVRSVLLRPLPYPEADRLVQIWTDERANGREEPEWLTPPDFDDWRRESTSFSAMAAYQGWGPDLTGDGDPESLAGLAVTGDFFAVLGVPAALGRTLSPRDDDPGAERVVVITDGLWRRRFGADPAMLGRAITLNGEPWTVAGVLPRDFRGPLPLVDLYRGLRRDPASGCGRDCIVLRAIGRLRPGVTAGQAQADLAAIAGRLAAEYPNSNAGRGAWLVPLHEQITGPVAPALLALTVAVGLVLLVGCVNLATLLLARGAARARELAVRAALGAGRARLVRQLMVESLLLAAAGGGLGLAVATVVARFAARLVPEPIRAVQPVTVDAAVIGFGLMLAAVAAVVFGLAPAVQAVRRDLTLALRSGGRTETARGGRLRAGLVVAELALAVMLLVGAGLLLRSFLRLQQVDLGYRTAGLLSTGVAFPRARYPDPARAELAVADLLERLRASAAIRSAEVTDAPPLAPGGDQDLSALPVGEPGQDRLPSLWYRSVSPGYHDLLGIRIVRGRAFAPTDRAGAAPVAIVNEETARRFWRGADPVGRELLADGGARVTVIGVAADGRHDGPHQPVKTELFVPMGQFPTRAVTLLVEPAGSEAGAIEAVRAALRAVDPLVPLTPVVRLADRAAEAVQLPRLYASLVAALAAVALGLAALGVFGVMAYLVALRRRELGVRVALGARPGAVRAMVLGQGVRLAALGAGIGLAGAALLTRLLRTLLFGVSPLDPLTFAAVALVLAGVSLAAAWLPASRAMRVDPLVAMRDD